MKTIWLGLGAMLLVLNGPLTEARTGEFQEYLLAATVKAKVTAYCPCRICCGKYANGKTATGRDARGRGAAVDPRVLPYGSILRIPRAGYVEADDTGGAMRQSWSKQRIVHIDLRMRTHAEARKWGVRWVKVAVYLPQRGRSRTVRQKQRQKQQRKKK